MQKLLVDENLSPSLVGLATDKGFVCSHVNHLGLTGQKDWGLKATILEGDWTFITNNGTDFRGPAKNPGSQGVYAGISLHAGTDLCRCSWRAEPGAAEASFRSNSLEPDRRG